MILILLSLSLSGLLIIHLKTVSTELLLAKFFVQFENNKKIEPPSNKLRFVHLFEEKWISLSFLPSLIYSFWLLLWNHQTFVPIWSVNHWYSILWHNTNKLAYKLSNIHDTWNGDKSWEWLLNAFDNKWNNFQFLKNALYI